jgi:spore germination protein YaaH
MRELTRRALRRAVRVSALGACAALAACAALPTGARRTAFWAFTAPWDPRSAASVVAHAGALDYVVTGWIALDTTTGAPLALFPDTVGARARVPRAMALVTSYLGDRFHPETIRLLAASDGARAATAGAVARLAAAARYRGLVLDFEGLRHDDVPGLVAVVRAIADSARARGVAPIVVAVPAPDTSGYPAAALAPPADFVLVMLYDEHWATSPPGAIAEPTWVRQHLGTRVAEVGADRIVAGLPTYGYQWRPATPAVAIGYDDARRLAAERGVPLARDAATATLRAAQPGEWELWVSDAGLLRILVRVARDAGVSRIALWRLGLEDPAVWREIIK